MPNRIVLLAFMFACIATTVPARAAEPLVIDHFDQDLSSWQVQEFNGRTDYRLITDVDGNKVLFASSRAGASGLFKELDFDPLEYPILSWRWKI